MAKRAKAQQAQPEATAKGKTLLEWKAWVDREVQALSMLRLEDLPDQDFWSDWQAGRAPEEAARAYLQAEGWSAE